MIEARILVNGTFIGHVYVRNTLNESTLALNEVLGEPLTTCPYAWSVYQPGKPLKEGKLHHDREEGWEALIEKVLKASRKQ